MAAADQFTITVRGRGGHASMPHDCADPVPAAAAIVGAIQAMVTRRFNATSAVVVTVTQLTGGSAHNVIPDTASLGGTIRTLTRENRARVRVLIAEVAKQVARAQGVEADCRSDEGFPVTVCDARPARLGQTVGTSIGGKETEERTGRKDGVRQC